METKDKNKFVLLIQPKHGSWDKIFCRLPESLLAISACPHKEGYEIKILDQRVEPDWKKKLVEYVGQKPLIVGITTLTGPSLNFALEAADIVKKTDKNTKVVFGGVHVTLLPEQSIKNDNVDIVVKGDADYTFLKLLNALEKNDNLDDIKGLYYKRGEEIIFTGEPDMIRDLDALSESPYNLVDMSKYSAVDFKGSRSVSFMTSRGCPYACKFCANATLHKSIRIGMSIPSIISKIEMLQEKYDYNIFLFLDENTSAGPAHFRELIKALNGLKRKIIWATTGIRADMIARLDDEDLKNLWDSGCRAMDIGVESGSDRVLKYINKAETKEIMGFANKKLAKYPIILKYTFIIGYPTETDEEMEETVDFYMQLSSENPNVFPMIFIYTPIVGTPLYSESLKYDFIPPVTMQEWADMDYKTWLYKYPNWIPKNKKRRLEVISISSLFCNSNVKYKLATLFSKVAFLLYHPIAKFRFKYKFFGFPVESFLSKLFF